jgi:hypothetical protein
MSVINFPNNACRRVRRHEIGSLERTSKPIQRTPRDGEDPIFAVIEHHRALSDRYTAAINQHSDFEDGPLDDKASEIVDEACEDLLDFCDDRLVRSEPTTFAGLVGFIRYIRTLEEWQTPRSDVLSYNKQTPSGWFCELCRTLENAIARTGRV